MMKYLKNIEVISQMEEIDVVNLPIIEDDFKKVFPIVILYIG